MTRATGLLIMRLAAAAPLAAQVGCGYSPRSEVAALAEMNLYAPRDTVSIQSRAARERRPLYGEGLMSVDDVIDAIGAPDLRAKPDPEVFEYDYLRFSLFGEKVDIEDTEVLIWHPALRARMMEWAELFVIHRRDLLSILFDAPAATSWPESRAVLAQGGRVVGVRRNGTLGSLCARFAVPFSVAADAILGNKATDQAGEIRSAWMECLVSEVVDDQYMNLAGYGAWYGRYRLVLKHSPRQRPVRFDIVEVSRRGERTGFAVVIVTERRSSGAAVLEGSAQPGDTARVLRTGPPDEARKPH